jgi:hypothetical protein
MPTTDTDICNLALLPLGASPLTDLDDDESDAATICRASYPPLRDSILSGYSWRFGIRRRSLTRDATTPYADGRWKYSFQLPPDRLSGGAFAAFRSNEEGARPFNDWEIIGDRLVSNEPEIWIEYPKQITEGDFPPYFINFIATALRALIAYGITDQQNAAEFWHGVAYGRDPDTTGGLELAAQLADAQQHPARSFDDAENYDLIAVRFG